MYKRIFLFIFAGITVIFYAIFGIFPFVGLILQVILIASIVAMFVFFMTKKHKKPYLQIVQELVVSFLAFIGVLLVVVSGFIAYHNIFPATLSNITLSNGSGSIVFMEMSHIGTDAFYQAQRDRINALAREGYTFLVEGVRPGTRENQERFDRMIGMRFTNDLYNSISELAGLSTQDQDTLFSGVQTGSLRHLDISIDDIVGLVGTGMLTVSGEIPDIGGELSGVTLEMNSGERWMLEKTLKALLNLSVKNSATIEASALGGDQSALFQSILHRRNDPLSSYVDSHPHDKIAIVYGALHFNELYERLQRRSPPWNIVHTEATFPYR